MRSIQFYRALRVVPIALLVILTEHEAYSQDKYPVHYLFGMGDNYQGQLGDGTTTKRHTPVQITHDAVIQVAGHNSYSVFVKEDRSLWGMGNNRGNLLEEGTADLRLSPVTISEGIMQVAAGFSHISWIMQDSTFWVKGQLSIEPPYSAIQVASGVVQTASGLLHTLFVKQDNSLWGMGANEHAQLGRRPFIHETDPIHIADSVRFISAGRSFSLFIKLDGSLWAIGTNNPGLCQPVDGCFGPWVEGTFTNRPEPFHIADNVEFASGGFQHALFIKSDSSLWAVGFNDYGQLGTGTTASTSIPVHIATNVVHATAGTHHSLFVKSDGSLWGMGRNYGGSLGDGTSSVRISPVHITNRVKYAHASGTTSLFIGMGDVSLSHPANETEDVPLSPVLTWQDFGGYETYDIQVAMDSSFSNVIVETSNHEGLEWDPSEILDELTTYYWRVRGIGADETGPWSPIWSFKTTTTTGIEDSDMMMDGIRLLPNYPNPFNPTTEIGYQVSEFGRIQITVHNLLGQRVAIVYDGFQTPGQHSVTFDASHLPSGVYMVVLETKNGRDIRKVSLLK